MAEKAERSLGASPRFHPPADPSPGAAWRGRCALAASVATVALVWLTILPLIGRQPAVRDYIERNERLGINPAAKFYTELPCMPGVFNRVERSMRRAHDDQLAL